MGSDRPAAHAQQKLTQPPPPPTPLGKGAISRQLNLHQVLKSVKDLFYGLGLYTFS